MLLASGPLARVFVGDKDVGEVRQIRGNFRFVPSWDASEAIPAQFSTSTALEMKMTLAEHGLRVETASSQITMDLELLLKILEWAREDSQSDVDLHKLCEHIERQPQPLTMENYPAITQGFAETARRIPVSINMTKLEAMLKMEKEIAASFKDMTKKEQQVYLRANPNSKFRKKT